MPPGIPARDARHFRCATTECTLLLQRQRRQHLPNTPPTSEGHDFNWNSWVPCRSFKMLLGGQCAVEWDEWQIVRALGSILVNSTVLELGARFGTTSCVLSEAVGEYGAVVSVEPDPAVQTLLLRNLASHRCGNVHVVRGVVGQRPQLLGPPTGYGGVGTRTLAASSANSSGVLPSVRLQAIESAIDRKIDALLIDCEGCIDNLLGEGAPGSEQLLSQLRLLLIEQDGVGVHYERYWWPRLAARGFVRAWRSQAWYDRRMQHTVWTKGNWNMACELHARREREAGRTLRCSAEL